MKTINYKSYKYKGLTPNREGDVIGYSLFRSGYVHEDETVTDPVCLHSWLNSEPLKDIAKIHFGEGEYFISQIHYSKYGNYLGDNDEYFTI